MTINICATKVLNVKLNAKKKSATKFSKIFMSSLFRFQRSLNFIWSNITFKKFLISFEHWEFWKLLSNFLIWFNFFTEHNPIVDSRDVNRTEQLTINAKAINVKAIKIWINRPDFGDSLFMVDCCPVNWRQVNYRMRY